MSNIVNIEELSRSIIGSEILDLGSDVYKIINGSTYQIIEVIDINLATKEMKIRHNHNVYDIHFKDKLDLVLDSMGIKRNVETINTDVKAPMPGKVIEVIAKEGDQILKGAPILILEAMKMENVLKAESDCVIKKVLISNQENVEKNQVLIELDF